MALVNARTLLHLLQKGDLDAAIDAGLMDWSARPDDGLDDTERTLLAQTRNRLHTAWAARERFRARQTRLERREHERRQRRAAQVAPAQPEAIAQTLSPTAAAILARARERAGIASK